MANEIRLTAIDDSNREIHPRLMPEDRCFFLFEYTSGKRWDFSATNGMISTLKRKPGQKGIYYKDQEIAKVARYYRATLNEDWLQNATLVPVPPSKAFGHAEHDPRMERICRAISPGLDVRSIVRQRFSTVAAHELGTAPRPSVEELVANYEIDEAQAEPVPKTIGIFDDVLTAGTHFKAVQAMLAARYPTTDIFGLFIARRVFPDDRVDFFGF